VEGLKGNEGEGSEGKSRLSSGHLYTTVISNWKHSPDGARI